MRILLIDPPGWQKHGLNLGLAYLAGAVRSADFDVLILDMNNHFYSKERVQKIVFGYNPDMIGVSVKTATAHVSADLIRELKNKFPNIKYVAGGPHVTLCGEEFLQDNPEVDFGITGEGEDSLLRLIKNIKEERSGFFEISGLWHRENGALVQTSGYKNPNIATLPRPAFDCIKDFDAVDFRYPLLTSRGCPHGCIFCCVGLIAGKKWRARELEDVVRELSEAKENYQITSFEIMDDNFTLDIDRAKKICKLMIERKLGLDWWCHNGLRADRLDQELLHLMKKAGCQSIALGIESGDREVFGEIGKGEELSDIVKGIGMIKKAGIKSVGYFIVGLPGDSVESTKKSVRFQRGLGLSDYKYNMLIPYPGTKVWDMVKESGRLLADVKGSYHFGEHIKIPFETSKISKKIMEQCLYLVENQDWVRGENDLRDIKKSFYGRFGRIAKKIVVLGEDLKSPAKNIEIECEGADILNIFFKRVPDETKDGHLLESGIEVDSFDALFRLAQERGHRIILDMPARTLFLQSIKKMENAYVRGEVLPYPLEWDGSTGKYFVTRLKKRSPDICAVKNGIVYQDNIALPFSQTPQWEKFPCGKIESGMVFISRAAFNPTSVYKADYLTVETESTCQELRLFDPEESCLEMIMRASDVLFCPDTSASFAFVFSRAKMNVLYGRDGRGKDSLRYKELEHFSVGWGCYFRRKAVRMILRGRASRAIAKKIIGDAGKCSKVCLLWIEILTYKILADIRNFISGIVRF